MMYHPFKGSLGGASMSQPPKIILGVNFNGAEIVGPQAQAAAARVTSTIAKIRRWTVD
jgi:hypothetical protein